MGVNRDMDEGAAKIEWARTHMPVLAEIEQNFRQNKPFDGMTIGMSIHLEAKTARLALCLMEGGADVAITGSNPLSTQDDVAHALAQMGAHVYAWYGESDEEHAGNLRRVLEYSPDLLLDDGLDLTATLVQEFPKLKSKTLAACEETTTGINRAKAMEKDGVLPFPIVAVNDARMKHLFDNRYGTGESALAGFLRATNLVVSSKIFVVAGYGWVGRGIAEKIRGMRGRVVITEVDPVRALEAVFDGFEVMPMKEAAKVGDVFLTATGNCGVIGEEHFNLMKDGAILANAGHFDVEVDVRALRRMASSRIVRNNIEEFSFSDGKKIYLIAQGRLINLAAGDGHPVEIMDLSFAVQALALEWCARSARELPVGLIPVPGKIDQQIAHIKLQTAGIQIDHLTDEQESYLSQWRYIN
ncbi:MAG: adenosylhomocysteinase [Firmicutes bacterium]|nr:adenosylhomocysteinase [Bacillota bacterium]